MRRLRGLARRLPRWAWWLCIGAPLGGVVLGMLAPPLFLLDSALQGGSVSDDLWIAPWAGLIAAVWGAVGGYVSGVVCALIICALDRRGERATGRLDAAVGAVVTTIVASLFVVFQFADAYTVTAWDVVIFSVVPVGVSAAVAAVAGMLIWRATRRDPVSTQR